MFSAFFDFVEKGGKAGACCRGALGQSAADAGAEGTEEDEQQQQSRAQGGCYGRPPGLAQP